MPDPQNQGSTTSSSAPTLQEGLIQFLEAKSKGDKSGNYRRNAKRVITRWINWFEQIDETVLAHYAQYLRRRVAANKAETTDGGITRSTAWTYYNTISAFLGWASKWGYIRENYARAGLAQESMPDRSTTQQTQQQFWTPDQREEILNYVNKRAHDAIEEKGLDAEIEARDRALVAVLAFTGVRGAEIFRSEYDNRTGRQGLRWRDVDLDEQTISVLGKNQQRQSAWLLEQAIPPVKRYRTVSDPPTDEWPVFPTRHAPSLYQRARSHLREVEGKDEESIEAILEEGSIDEILREYQITPPAITTTGARSVMKRLCEAADIDVLAHHLVDRVSDQF